jgi:polar amino acid transport system substrate-binding protein
MKKSVISFLLPFLLLGGLLSCSDDSNTPSESKIDGAIANKLIVKNATLATTGGIAKVFSTIITNEVERSDFLRGYFENIRFLPDNSGYFFCYDTNFVCVAHPILKNYIGTSHLEDVDSKGKHFPYEIMDSLKTKGFGWIDFNWYDQTLKLDLLKTSFVKMINDNYWLGAGLYADYLKGTSMTDNEMHKQMIKQIVHFTAVAFKDVHTDFITNSDKYIEFIRTYADGARFLDDNSGYFFVDGLDGINIAFPTNKELEGTNIWDLTDAKGNYSVRAMAELINASGSGYIEYYYNNPSTNQAQLKIVYVEKIEGTNYFIGSGYYQK